jgi:hypothetical protein
MFGTHVDDNIQESTHMFTANCKHTFTTHFWAFIQPRWDFCHSFFDPPSGLFPFGCCVCCDHSSLIESIWYKALFLAAGRVIENM